MEKLRMVMLLFVFAILFHRDRSSSVIREAFLGLFNYVNKFIEYPWGRHSFIHLISQLQKPLKEKAQTLLEQGKTESTISYQGFVFPLAINKIFKDNVSFYLLTFFMCKYLIILFVFICVGIGIWVYSSHWN